MAGGVWVLQESPRCLVDIERFDEAMLALRKLHGTGNNEDFLDLEFREIRDTIVAEQAVAVKSWKEMAAKASWRRRLLLGCGVQAFGQPSGVNVSLSAATMHLATPHVLASGHQLLRPAYL
jgi:Sugar (and other) transporter